MIIKQNKKLNETILNLSFMNKLKFVKHQSDLTK